MRSINVYALRLTIPFLLLTITAAYGQRSGFKVIPVTNEASLRYTLQPNQQLIFPDGWTEGSPVVALQTLQDGYIFGTNEYDDRSKGQAYSNKGGLTIHGAYFWIGAASGDDGIVEFHVREFVKTPGRILASGTLKIREIRQQTDSSGWLYVTFDRPVRLTGGYYVGMDISKTGGDKLGLVSSSASSHDQVTWEQRNDLHWYNTAASWTGLTPDIRLGIFPVVSRLSGFAGGDGTKSDPYQVENAEQLDQVREYARFCFIQIADIDLGVSPWTDGEGWQPLEDEITGFFSGAYDGNGYTIHGLYIHKPDRAHTGLFGHTVSATLKDIILANVHVTGAHYSGALTGAMTGGVATGIEVSGIVNGKDYTGGMVGYAAGSIVTDCHVSVAVHGFSHVGGLAGSARVELCSSAGTVTGMDSDAASYQVGGLLGDGFALNCQSSVMVSGHDEVGGLIGTGAAFGSFAAGVVNASGDYVGGLIGSLGKNAAVDEDGTYVPGEVAPADTAVIRDSINTSGSGPAMIVLEDETRVVIYGNGLPMHLGMTRSDSDIDLENYVPDWSGLRVTGSMRRLQVEGQGDPEDIKPVITIPLSEAGTIDPVTLVILRVGDLDVNGTLMTQHGVIMPVVTIEHDGMKFVDAMFADGATVTEDITGEPDVRKQDQRWVGDVRYFVLTFDNSLNWSQRPVLERMIPDSMLTDAGYRRLARKASRVEQKELLKKPICNVVILVHGHNEEEGDGFVASRIASPWNFRYKRILWDLLYQEALTDEDSDYPDECTAFYEFISPTYRPIFSPVPDKSGLSHTTLGEDLGRLVNEEFQHNPQLKAMIEADMPFNIYLVAHSQGGLVARAGLRFMHESVLEHLKKVVTWGSPHRGAGLYSLRYALAVGHDIVIDGFKFPMQNIGQSQSYQSFLSTLAMDAPGIRDLRWDASKKSLLRLGDLLRENSTTLNEFQDTELPHGKLFFSDNLQLFNDSEGTFSSQYLQNKYMFYDGITPKDAPLELGWSWNSLRRLYYFKADATNIEKGSQLNKLVMEDPNKPGDGASCMYSQAANAVWGSGGIEHRHFDDIDHEEFYGSEPPLRDDASKEKGRNVVALTFEDLGFIEENSSCPEIEAERMTANDTLTVSGAIVYPIYEPAHGGDGKVGERIVRMEARLGNARGQSIPALVFEWEDDGQFTSQGALSEIPLSNDTLVIVAIFRDSSEAYGVLVDKIPWTKCSIDFQIRFGEVEYTNVNPPSQDTSFVTIGHSTYWSGNDNNIGEFSGQTFEGHSANGREHIRVTLNADGNSIEEFEFTLNAPHALITLNGHDVPVNMFAPVLFEVNAGAGTCDHISGFDYSNSNEFGSFRLLSYACASGELSYITITFAP